MSRPAVRGTSPQRIRVTLATLWRPQGGMYHTNSYNFGQMVYVMGLVSLPGLVGVGDLGPTVWGVDLGVRGRLSVVAGVRPVQQCSWRSWR